jgi:ABC-2 type transport system ATP-binding protein
MNAPAIVVDSVSKNFRIYHERNRYLKAAVLRGRRARYEEFWALNDVSFDVPHGATVGLIGANGSGKSTMLKCLTGIYRPDRGRIHVNGSVAALLELGAGFHPELSGRENVFLNAAILGMTKRDAEARFDSIVEFAGLERFIDTPVKNYSSGMTVRLGFSIATHVEPEILLIDEVLSVGDQSFQRKSSEKIDQFRRDGRTIVVVSHSLGAIQQLCREVIWLDKGQVKQRGPSADVIAAYTGDSYGSHTAVDDEGRERWGTGAVRINELGFARPDGGPIERIESGEAIRIVVGVTPEKRVESPIVNVSIGRSDGTIVWGSSSLGCDPPLRRLDEPTTITIDLDALPLLEGSYFLSAWITDSTGTTEHDHCRHWCRLDVHQEHLFETGIVSIPSRWAMGG